jgi:hypothetical protein
MDTDADLTRQARGEAERHWLIFDNERHVTGCHCGFPADPGDDGYGDSIVMHLLTIGPAALSAELAEAKAEARRESNRADQWMRAHDNDLAEAEAERDALAAQIDALRAGIERLATDHEAPSPSTLTYRAKVAADLRALLGGDET